MYPLFESNNNFFVDFSRFLLFLLRKNFEKDCVFLFHFIKKWATPTRSCSPIAVILVSKQRKTARLILRNFLWYKKSQKDNAF